MEQARADAEHGRAAEVSAVAREAALARELDDERAAHAALQARHAATAEQLHVAPLAPRPAPPAPRPARSGPGC